MPAVDDGQFVKLYNGNSASVDTNEVLIGTSKTSGASERLATFVTDINGTPTVKAYIDGSGNFVAASGDLTIDDLTADDITADAISAASVSTSADATVGGGLTVTGAVLLGDELDLTNAGVIGTAPSGTGITVPFTATVRNVLHKVTVTYLAAQAAAATKDVTLWTLPAKSRVQRIIVDVTTPFTGGAISDCDVTVGKSAGGNEYLLSFDVDSATGTFGDTAAELGASILGGGSFASDIVWASTTTVQCRFTAVGANLSDLTAGSMSVYIEVAVYP